MPDKEQHLLLIEDEVALREATAERLEEHGYHVVQVGSGEDALQLGLIDGIGEMRETLRMKFGKDIRIKTYK